MAGRPCQRVTPPDVEIHDEPRPMETDPTLGIQLDPPDGSNAKHHLVTIGDSLTHGFMSGAIYRTDISWPAIVAYELGLQADGFRFPTYEWPNGPGGIPLDLERLARAFQDRYGERLDWHEQVGGLLWLRSWMDRVEDYWERGPGSETPATGDPFQHGGVRLGRARRPAARCQGGRRPHQGTEG